MECPQKPFDLDSTYRGIVENLVCDRLHEMRPRDVVKTFARIFQGKAIVSQTLMMTEACSAEKTGEIWKATLEKASNPRDRGKIFGALLFELGGLLDLPVKFQSKQSGDFVQLF